VKTVSDKGVRHSLTSVRRLAVAKRSCNCSYSIFARSSSAVTASEKSSINTNRKSNLWYLQNGTRSDVRYY